MKRLLRLLMCITFAATGLSACQEPVQVEVPKQAPRLISVVPSTVWNGCTAIISGIGFSEVADENVVTVDGQQVAVSMATSNRLTLTMPEHADGKAVIAVSVNGLEADTVLETNYAQLPELVAKVTGIAPVKGFAGDVVTISGENFSANPSDNLVTFGDVPATVESATSTTLKVIAPEHAKGAVNVQVVTGGKTLTAPSQFTYMVFSLTSVAPTMGASGDEVTLTGEGFIPVPEENIVLVNGQPAVVKSATETQLVVVMPDNPEGKYDFTLTVAGKSITGGQFTYGGSWRVQTLVTGFSKVQDIVSAADGTYWVTRRENASFGIYKFDPSGNSLTPVRVSQGSSASSTDLLAGSHPWGGDEGPDGKFYFAAKATSKILSCDAKGNIAEYVINNLQIANPMKVLCSADGSLYVLIRGNNTITGKVVKVNNNEVLKTWDLVNGSHTYEYLCFNADKTKIFVFPCDCGDMKMIDLADDSIKTVAGTGTKHTSAAEYTDGTPGNPFSATLNQVEGAICAADGTIYFTDSAKGKTIRTFKPDANGDYTKGTIETILGTPYDSKVIPYPNGIAFAADGKTLYYLENGGQVRKIYYK
jgi:hypothetical protein